MQKSQFKDPHHVQFFNLKKKKINLHKKNKELDKKQKIPENGIQEFETSRKSNKKTEKKNSIQIQPHFTECK